MPAALHENRRPLRASDHRLPIVQNIAGAAGRRRGPARRL